MQAHHDWQTGIINRDKLGMAWARRAGDNTQPVHVYVEGDGRAYITRSQPSTNPTPAAFGAWQLALADNSRAEVVYLARPCQFVDVQQYTACTADIWTTERFTARQQGPLAQLFDQLTSGRAAIVIGYSGGAVHALELARTHANVVGVVTLAGNLNPDATNRWHKVSALTGSLNPLGHPGRLADVPVLHVVGADDKVVPPGLIAQVLQASPALPCNQQKILPGVTHTTGWLRWWQDSATLMFKGL